MKHPCFVKCKHDYKNIAPVPIIPYKFNFIMKNIVKFGEIVDGFNIPVLNEREIRASAGLLFLLMFTALMLIIFKGNFLLIKHAIVLFLVDFIIRVFVNPKYSPTLILGRLIVSRQNPEYVGAPQKKFAWIIGIVLSGIMFVLMVVFNSYSIITGLICLICLIFLFFESAFGICLGCLFYGMMYKEKAQYCPGEFCDSKAKQEIQKVSKVQLLMVLAFALFITGMAISFNQSFSAMPGELFQMISEKMSSH